MFCAIIKRLRWLGLAAPGFVILGAGANLAGEDHFPALAMDSMGNTYVLGDFFGVNDFDPWPASGVKGYEPQSLLQPVRTFPAPVYKSPKLIEFR